MDAALNLPKELYSLGVRKLVAREVACNSYDHAVGQTALHCAVPVGKRQVEQLAVRAAEDFEAFYEKHQQCRVLVDASHLLVLTFDGAAIRVHEQDLREPTKKKRAAAKDIAAERWPAPKGTTRTSSKRRAMVAGIYDVAAFPRTPMDIVRDLRPVQATDKERRPRPVNKRIWASIEHDCERAVDDAFAYALERDPDKQRTWVALTDGDEHQIECIRRRARELGVNVVIILDVIHV
ncbi:MAG TPA: ISKra4 family transposase, partial [Polyangiaceae bacterium]|nr:ISKra4 family transposase [Polyangiaceae bacterium]